MRGVMGAPSSAFIVGYVGRVHEDKGVYDVLRLAADVEDIDGRPIWFAMFGQMELKVPSEFESALHEAPNVYWHGPTADVVTAYALIDLLILPSRREGFPNVVLEAACCSVPTLAYACTGVVDAVVGGSTGWLVPSGNYESLRQALLAAVSDPEEIARRGAHARRRALEEFSPDHIVRQTLKYYEFDHPERTA